MTMVHLQWGPRPEFTTWLAVHILDNVVRRILNRGVFIGDRVALAYAWARFMCRHTPPLCEDLDMDIEKWGEEELRKVADKLSLLASNFLLKATKS